jgi:acyl-CoA thioesterase YciA
MDAARTPSDRHSADPAVLPRGELAARHLAMPAHTNPAGNIFGGWIMASMAAAAGMTTTRLAEAHRTSSTILLKELLHPY